MYVVANRVAVAEGWEETFEERFRHRAGQIEHQPGFVSMQILRPASEDAPYVVLTHWESEEAFNNWVNSEDFKQAHANPLPSEAFSGQGQLERYELVISAQA